LRGAGGNFGVVTAMRLELHRLPSVRSGMLIYPFAEAKAVLEGCAEIGRSAPEELTSQVGFAGRSRRCSRGHGRSDMVRSAGGRRGAARAVLPAWDGANEHGGNDAVRDAVWLLVYLVAAVAEAHQDAGALGKPPP
jgi:FAD/FMN-containing dehydrogenase